MLSGNMGRMMADYHQRRAEQRAAALHAEYPPRKFVTDADHIRSELTAAFRMPALPGPPEATQVRATTVDGIRVEIVLLKIRPGDEAPADVYLPPSDAEGQHPAILMLPGHGDVTWSPSVQARCLYFAKRGYVVLQAQPFGQGERGDNPLWNEDLDSQAMAYLMTTGQTLLGLVQSDLRAELAYLAGRRDVAPGALYVTGVSLGGTATIWLEATDTRMRGGVAVAAAPLYQPNNSSEPSGLVDLIVGAYNVADMDMIQALCAPRPFMHIYPNTEVPLTAEGLDLYQHGRITPEEAERRYAHDEAGLAQEHSYEHQVYALMHAPDNFQDKIVPGPHDYTLEMLAAAVDFLAPSAHPSAPRAPAARAPLNPIRERAQARAATEMWPDGSRPREVLSPTAYTEQRAARMVARLPGAPDSRSGWEERRAHLQAVVRRLLGVDPAAPDARTSRAGVTRMSDAVVTRLIVTPESGIQVPVLLFRPPGVTRAESRLVVLLNQAGMNATAASGAWRPLVRAGDWVACTDLRGMGETQYSGESGFYLGFRDYDIAYQALKLGETLAGYRVRDLLAVIHAAQSIAGKEKPVVVRADREEGLVAILAAGQSEAISAVETTGLLASYASAQGYGRPYAYRDAENRPPTTNAHLGGYGSMLPCIPGILTEADIPQLAALVAPRPLTIQQPLWASGNPLEAGQIAPAFRWTQEIYRALGAESALALTP
ncbi:MAG TPA: dienelactone hydrolase family protein [Chthonomonadaceae bacterium]|nr:dienelactone hydrolase family protein [Chthonomonadaceae bacterium]